MTELITYQFKEIMKGFYDGPHATPPPSDEGPVFLGIKNIKEEGGIDLNEIRHISENDYAKWTKRVTPKEGDIVFSYEATLHRYAMIPSGFRGCLGRRMALIRLNLNIIDNNFLYYYFLSPYWRAFIETVKVAGSTVDRISIIDFPRYRISLPPLPTQKKIASILSAYDELIENNNQRIKLLEEMAEEIYKEWFVRLRFPGHEHTPIHDGVPEGWEKKSFEQCANFINGYAFKPSDWKEDGLPIIKIAELKNGITDKTPKNLGLGIPKKYHVAHGELLFSWSADLDAYIWNEGKGLLNQHIFKVVPVKDISKEFIFYSLKTKMSIFRSMSNGATMQHIKRSELGRVFLEVPPESILEKFTKIISPMLDESGVLKSKNQVLKETRDLLLPRLISGKLSVEHLLEESEPAAIAAETGEDYH